MENITSYQESSNVIKPQKACTIFEDGPASPLPEEKLDNFIDGCMKDAFIKGGTGFGIGLLCSVLIFRRLWPPLFGTSFGLGMAYKECDRSLKLQTQCKPSE